MNNIQKALSLSIQNMLDNEILELLHVYELLIRYFR